MNTHVDHETLDVHQEAIGFVSTVEELLERISKALAVHHQRCGTEQAE